MAKSSRKIPLTIVQLTLLRKGPAIQAAKLIDKQIALSDSQRKRQAR